MLTGHKWAKEAAERCPDVPIILVGLKNDLRKDPVTIEAMQKKSQRFVRSEEELEGAQNIGAKKYLECSSLTGQGVDDVFEAATRAHSLPGKATAKALLYCKNTKKPKK
jgi:Rho family protein